MLAVFQRFSPSLPDREFKLWYDAAKAIRMRGTAVRRKLGMKAGISFAVGLLLLLLAVVAVGWCLQHAVPAPQIVLVNETSHALSGVRLVTFDSAG